MKKRYGDENVRYAIATKLAMKEDITDEALTIQDWNVDDIKFTEIETVDIIKPKPIKEGMAGALVKGRSKLIPALMTGIGAAGTIMQSQKEDDKDAENIFSEVEKMMKKKNPSTGNRSRAERRIAELKDKLRQNADKRRMEKSYKKPASDKLEEVMAAPTNNVGGGKIAGTVEAGDNPPVKKKKRYIYGGTGSRKMWMTKK